MRIRTLFILLTLASVIFLGFLFLDLTKISALNRATHQKSDFANHVSTTISQLNILSNEYVLHHERRVLEQWIKRWNKLQQLLQETQFEDDGSNAIVKSLRNHNLKIKNLFDRTVNATKTNGQTSIPQESKVNIQERALASQLLNIIFEMDNKARQLYLASQTERIRFEDLHEDHLNFMFFTIIAILLMMLVIIIFRVVKPLQVFKGQLKSFNSEQRTHELNIKNNDEIGEMVSTFIQLIRNLQATQVSTEQLQKETEERKRAERNLDAFFDQPLHLHMIMDFNGVLHRVNTAWKSALGYNAKEVKQHTVTELVHPRDRQKMNAAIAELRQGNSVPELEIRCVNRNNNDYRLLMWSASPSVDDSLIYVIATDITEQRAARKDREHLQRELYQSQKMDVLGKLTGGIAHDFNNILGIIMGNVELAQDLVEDKDQPVLLSYLQTIHISSERARDLVSRMMMFSRTGNGDSYPRDILPMVRDDIDMLKSVLPTSMEIDLFCQPNLPKVKMDSIKLQQILMNLCLNAKDAMHGVGKLTIRLGMKHDIKRVCSSCRQSIEGKWLELSVSDTGSGMASDKIEHIFEPFFTTKEVNEGTGFGLSMVENAIKSVGGHIIVESKPAKGSTFRLLFPPSDNSGAQEIDKEKITNSYTTVDGKGRSILVVDDEPALASLMSKILVGSGFRPTSTTSSAAALDMFRSRPDEFDLVITDQTMPQQTGMELAAEMRKIRPKLPIILISGYSDTTDKQAADNQGIHFLSKPVRAKELIKLVNELSPGISNPELVH